MPAGDHDRYAWLEKIENGTLVHYAVAVKTRLKQPSMGFDLDPGMNPDYRGNPVLEIYGISQKTVYCKDLEAVFQVIRLAEAAQEEITKLARDGKFSGDVSLASS